MNDIVIKRKEGYQLSFENKKTRLLSEEELPKAEEQIKKISNGVYIVEKSTRFELFDPQSNYNKGRTENFQILIFNSLEEAEKDREWHYKQRESYAKIEAERLKKQEEKRKADFEFCRKIDKIILSGNGEVFDLDYYVELKNISIPLSKRRTLNAFYWCELTNGRVRTLRGSCSFRTANTLIEYIRTQIK